MRLRARISLLPTLVAVACGGGTGEAGRPGASDPQLVFWDALQQLCGQAFEGTIVGDAPVGAPVRPAHPVVGIASCDFGETRFTVDLDPQRSQRWVVRTTAAGLRLAEDLRVRDGSRDAGDPFSGDTRGRGTAMVQDFQADGGETADEGEPQEVRTLEIRPGELLAFAVRRGNERLLRIEFDLSRPVERPPPAPAG